MVLGNRDIGAMLKSDVIKLSGHMDFSHLHEKFYKSYKKRYDVLIRSWGNVRVSNDADDFKSFKFNVHSLKGEAGALGFSSLFKIISTIDAAANHIQKNGFDSDVVSKIDQSLNKLIAAHKQNPNPLLVHAGAIKKPAIEVQVDQVKQSQLKIESIKDIHIALIDDDVAASNATTELLASFGFEVAHFTALEDFKNAETYPDFELVLLDLIMPYVSEDDVFKFAKQCIAEGKKVIPMSSRDDLNTRLKAVRSGVHDYAVKPININNLVGKIRHIFQLDLERPFKIVLLDDQETIGQYFEQIAEKQGFELSAFSNAQTFIGELDVSIPDVFLLDINMPHISGLEVAKILRQEPRFQYVPIVFLSSDTTLETKIEALKFGGEDVISKNDSPEDIFSQIESRMVHGQQIRGLASKDGLTGLLNHAQLMEAVANCRRISERTRTDFAVAILDLDNFKKINDTYGHSIGDNVLVGLAQLIKRRVRQTDISGRYGGEEFIIVFQDIKEMGAIIGVLNDLRKTFGALEFESDTEVFHATFSCGVTYNNAGMDDVLKSMKQADSALYEAKRKGKNKVSLYIDTNHKS